nr:hypothetical protein [Tanacetum cinerariifolium]
MEILDTMISDAIKKSVGYNFYIAKKNESAKDKIVDEPEEQRVGSKNETDDADDSDMDLSDDNLESDDDKFKEYDQKLEALTNFNVSKAFEKVVQARVLKEIKKLLPTHIPKAIANYEDSRVDFFKPEMSNRTEGNVYSDLRIKLVARIMVKKKWVCGFLTSIVVRRFDEKEYEFSYADLPRLSLNDVEDMYLLQVQDKIHHLLLEFVKDFNNALLLFIRRVMIQNRVEDIQIRVESYQQTLCLTKPMMFFEGINQRIPFTMSTTHKGAVYLNQHNFKSLMRQNNVKKFCDGTLEKIQENLIDMALKNKLGKGNKRLKVRD